MRLAQRASEAGPATSRAAWQAMGGGLCRPAMTTPKRRERFIQAGWNITGRWPRPARLTQLFSVIEAALTMLFDLQMHAPAMADSQLTGMDDARALHRRVYERFEAGDATGSAEAAMRELIEHAVLTPVPGLRRMGWSCRSAAERRYAIAGARWPIWSSVRPGVNSADADAEAIERRRRSSRRSFGPCAADRVNRAG